MTSPIVPKHAFSPPPATCWDIVIAAKNTDRRSIRVFAASLTSAYHKALEQLADDEFVDTIASAKTNPPWEPTDSRRFGRRLVLATIAISTALALSACSAISQGDLAINKKTLATCPTSQIAADGLIDTSGSVRANAVPEAYAEALKDLVRRTAVCGGHLHVGAFSSSAASTVTLYDGDLVMPGSTENAQLRRVPQGVADVMKTVNTAYADKVPGMTSGGTDIVAQYRLAHEYVQQLGGDRQLELLLLTDGYQNAGFVLGDRALSEADAKALAAQADIPQLPGATITVAGIGKTPGRDSATTEIITGMKTFYDALCQRSGASSCSSVTDYTPAGG
ncbi:vWA domain-containing protein [Arthrobacter sp. HLT1-20]